MIKLMRLKILMLKSIRLNNYYCYLMMNVIYIYQNSYI